MGILCKPGILVAALLMFLTADDALGQELAVASDLLIYLDVMFYLV